MHTQNVILRIPVIVPIILEKTNFQVSERVNHYNCQQEFRQSGARFLHYISGAEVIHSHS